MLGGTVWAQQASIPEVANEHVLLKTDYGDIILALYSNIAPKQVQYFIELVRAGAYDTTHFNRIESGFLIQLSSIHDRLVPLTPEQISLDRPPPPEDSTLPHRTWTLTTAHFDHNLPNTESSFSFLLKPSSLLTP